jgi:hypothetical protein
MNVSTKAIEVINLVKNAVSKSITGVSFFSIKDYTNANGEVSNQLINVGINYDKSKASDLIFLENLNLDKTELVFKSDLAILKEAKAELIAAFIKPNENRSNGQIDAYTTIFSGVKVHNETGKLYVYGYRVNKTVLIEGTYKTVKSSALTIAKNELRKHLKTDKFVNFSIEIGNTIKANGETIEL